MPGVPKAMLVIVFFIHATCYGSELEILLTIPASMMRLFLAVDAHPDVARMSERYAEERARCRQAQAAVKNHRESHSPAPGRHDHSDHRAAKPSTEQSRDAGDRYFESRYAYGSQQALIDLSLEIRPGDCFPWLRSQWAAAKRRCFACFRRNSLQRVRH